MSTNELERIEFRKIDLTTVREASPQLLRQLHQVRQHLGTVVRIKHDAKVLALAVVFGLPVLAVVWAVLSGLFIYLFGFWSFLLLMPIGIGGLFAALCIAGISKDDDGGYFIAVGSLIAGTFPILPGAAIVVSLVVAVSLVCAQHNAAVSDNRLAEYKSLLEHERVWEDWRVFLTRLQAKIDCNQIDQADIPRAQAALLALKADEQFFLDRIRYANHLASEGSFGSVTARAELGSDGVFDLADRMQAARTRIKELRDIDRRAIAALEVATLKS